MAPKSLTIMFVSNLTVTEDHNIRVIGSRGPCELHIPNIALLIETSCYIIHIV